MRRLIMSLAVLVFGLAAAPRAGAQETATRFTVSGVADSTFSFAVGRYAWVSPGQRGIVVDPRQRDALVANFRVLRVQRGLATALITGQYAAVTTQHAVLLEQPATPWYRQRSFWIGVVLGGVIGAAASSF
jgi:hypothetical protein